MNPYEPPCETAEPTGVPAKFAIRVAKVHRRLAFGLVPYFSSVLSLFVWSAYWNIGKSFPFPKAMVIGFGLFWGVWLLVSVWFLMFCIRFRIIGNENSLTVVGIFGKSTFRADSTTVIRWRTYPRWGSVRILDPLSKKNIDFGMLEYGDRLKVTGWLRKAIPLCSDRGWPEFDEKIIRREWPQKKTIHDLI